MFDIIQSLLLMLAAFILAFFEYREESPGKRKPSSYVKLISALLVFMFGLLTLAMPWFKALRIPKDFAAKDYQAVVGNYEAVKGTFANRVALDLMGAKSYLNLAKVEREHKSKKFKLDRASAILSELQLSKEMTRDEHTKSRVEQAIVARLSFQFDQIPNEYHFFTQAGADTKLSPILRAQCYLAAFGRFFSLQARQFLIAEKLETHASALTKAGNFLLKAHEVAPDLEELQLNFPVYLIEATERKVPLSPGLVAQLKDLANQSTRKLINGDMSRPRLWAAANCLDLHLFKLGEQTKDLLPRAIEIIEAEYETSNFADPEMAIAMFQYYCEIREEALMKRWANLLRRDLAQLEPAQHEEIVKIPCAARFELQ